MAAALVETERLGVFEQRKADRSDATIEFGDDRGLGDKLADAVDGPFEERKMVLAKGRRWKEDVDARDRFNGRGLSREVRHFGTENRIASFGLCVEEESLQSIAEAPLDRFGQIAEDFGRFATADEYDLQPLTRPFDDELEITECAAMGSIGIGGNAGFANRFADFPCGFIDQWMVNGAMRRVHDAMTPALEESDLWIARVAPDRQSRAVPMSATGQGMDRRVRKSCGSSDIA